MRAFAEPRYTRISLKDCPCVTAYAFTELSMTREFRFTNTLGDESCAVAVPAKEY